jgi:hypothetical protein
MALRRESPGSGIGEGEWEEMRDVFLKAARSDTLR